MPYEIIDRLTMADIAFRASGTDCNELFLEAGKALVSIMLEDTGSVIKSLDKNFMMERGELDELMFSYLQEFIFFKDSESLILIPEYVKVSENNGRWYCACMASGEKIDRARHCFSTDIKSVTMHNLKVWNENGIFLGQVVLDV